MDQARKQADIAALENRKLEWHFAEKLASKYFENRFKLEGGAVGSIIVRYGPLIKDPACNANQC